MEVEWAWSHDSIGLEDFCRMIINRGRGIGLIIEATCVIIPTLCLYVGGFWIGVVVLKFEWEIRKRVVFDENELDDDFEMN